MPIPGKRFEDLLREAIMRGLVPEAAGREDEWIRERLQLRAHPHGVITREVPGGRWRRIIEKRLPDGGLLAFSTDVTDLVQRERELQRLNEQRDAYAQALQEANARLELLSDTDEPTQVARSPRSCCPTPAPGKRIWSRSAASKRWRLLRYRTAICRCARSSR